MAAVSHGNGAARARFDGAGVSDILGAGMLPRLMIIMFCSLVVLLQSSIDASRTSGDGAAESYGISVGAISFGFTIVFILFAKKKPDTFANWVLPKVRGELSVTQLFSLFIFVWWFFGTAILTFFAPYTYTSNAFFATWTAVITAALMMAAVFQRVQIAMQASLSVSQDANVKALAGLTVFSTVVLFSSIEYVGTTGEATFSLIAGLLSLLASAMLYYLVDKKRVGAPTKKGLGAFFVLLWFVAVCVLTFDGPFNITGNGYFGTWAAMFCSLSFAYQEFVGGEIPLGSIRASFAFATMADDEPISTVSVHPEGANVA